MIAKRAWSPTVNVRQKNLTHEGNGRRRLEVYTLGPAPEFRGLLQGAVRRRPAPRGDLGASTREESLRFYS